MRARWALGVAVFLVLLAVAWTIHGAMVRRQAEALIRADPEAILSDPALRATATTLGHTVFEEHCAACHGPAGRGDRGRGAPDLADGDWLYGTGRVAEIEQTVLHGIRSGDARGWNLAYMPAYARAKPYGPEAVEPLRPAGVQDVAAYIRSLHDATGIDPATVARGQAIYAGKGGCWDCHGGDAGGDPAIGAPNLVDDVWLYGDGSQASVAHSIAYGRFGRMPAFAPTLNPMEARAVAAYVASLSQPDQKEDLHGAD
ncbi:MAG TPA: c-type cytochrome [Sphingobium sp.]